jgi:hypothetical protein
MKVGVLTCHSCLNYGANLQLFATVRTLEGLGHEVFVYDNFEYTENQCRSFVVEKFHLTGRCRKDEDFRSETIRLGIEVILVGSDAVLWFIPGQTEGFGAYPNPFWLRWAKDLPIRKALLAGSCMGVLPIRCLKLRAQLKKDLNAFHYISVRDRWTLDFVKWMGIRKAELIFDPTSGLSNLFRPDATALPEGLEAKRYIMMTFSPDSTQHEDWFAEVTDQAHRHHLKTCFVPHPDRICTVENVDVVMDGIMDPLHWLSLLGCSAGYVGERFHPVVLSAFYGVPFISSDYYSRSGFASMMNGRSKTRDFCGRIGQVSRVLPADVFFKRTDPCSVLDSLSENIDLNIAPIASRFVAALKGAIGFQGTE